MLKKNISWMIPFFITLTALAALFGGGASGPMQSVAAYIVLMLLPGAAIYLTLTKKPGLLNLSLHALLSSPVIVAAIGVLLLLTGMDPRQSSTALIILFSVFSVGVSLLRRQIGSELNSRQGLILSLVIFSFFMMVGYMPLTNEWWRMRSDAWFHAAVVAEIDGYGLPPGDPFFAGFVLQYMWLYHVLILIVSKATRIDPFVVMPLLNLHAMAGFVISTFLLSTGLRRHSRHSFAYGLASVFVAVLGLNALFWVFFPIKALRAFTGNVRGWQEITNIFSLSPLNIHTVRSFLRIYYNQVFFLDKFIVSTAFSLGLAYMAMLWYGTVSYLEKRSTYSLASIGIALLGLLFFHSAVGFILIACFFASLVLVHLARASIEDYLPASSLKIFLAGLAVVAAASPYLYAIVHYKEADSVFPLGLSLNKSIGILISSALGLILAPFQFRRLFNDRRFASSFTLITTGVIIVFCQIVVLPGVNTLDKLPFFVFFPLSVLGGWTLVDTAERRGLIRKSRVLKVAGFLLLFGPLNVIALTGYYHTPTEDILSSDEKAVSEWARRNTSRDAVFIDSDDRVFLLVSGPRRYYWGTDTYSKLWGYSKEEMARRRHVRDNIYSSRDLDDVTLRALGSVDEELFIITRADRMDSASDGSGPMVANREFSKFLKHPGVFHKSFSAGKLSVYKVNRQACLLEARKLNEKPEEKNQENLKR